MVKIEDDKHILWQAFLVAIAIFIIGIFLGTLFEESRIDKIKELYFDSETDLLDIQLQSNILSYSRLGCDVAVEESRVFADKIFFEALLLEKYDSANKITKDMVSIHRRYDLLRIMLWENLIEIKENCEEEIDVVVYLYEYINPSLEVQSKQNTFSNSLTSLKKKEGNNIILIPMAHDTNVKSLDLILKRFNISQFPVVIINEEIVVDKISSVEDLKAYLN